MIMQTMGQDVAPAGHINEGMTFEERCAKYGIDPASRTARNQVLSAERKEALEAGLAPDVPITEEAARVFSREIEAQKKAQMMRYFWVGLVAVGGLYLVTRKKR